MDKDSWIRCMSKIGEVIVDETQEEEIKKDTIMINEDDLNREFVERKVPKEHEIRSKYIREKGKKQRV